jgi:lysophospholipase L1-like esterase
MIFIMISKNIKSRITKLSCLTLSLSLSLAVAEFVARRFLPELHHGLVVVDSRGQTIVGGDDETYHHKPLWDEVPTPNSRAYRIIFLGDSFTWGLGLTDRKRAFPHVVERIFSEGSVDEVAPRAVQTFNLGTPSYSPSIYGVVLRNYAPILKPDLVVLALDDSDPQDDLIYRPYLTTDGDGLPLSVNPLLRGVPGFLVPLATRVKLVRLSLAYLDKAYRRLLEPKPLKEWKARFGHYRPGPGTDDQWAQLFQHTLSIVSSIQKYCYSNNIKLAILNYPYLPAVTTHDLVSAWRRKHTHFGTEILYQPTFHDAVRVFSDVRHIPYYDFTTYLRSLPDHHGLVVSDEDPHYSPKGHELLAREVVKFLAPLVNISTASRSR